MTRQWRTVPRGGLIEAIQPQCAVLGGLPEEFRQFVCQFLEACYQSDTTIATFREAPLENAPATARSLFCALRMLAQLGDCGMWRRVWQDRRKIHAQIDRYYNPELGIYQGIDRHDAGHIGQWHLHDGYLYLPKALAILNLESRPIVAGLENLSRFPWAPQQAEDLTAWLHRATSENLRAGVKEITQYLALYRLLTGCDQD